MCSYKKAIIWYKLQKFRLTAILPPRNLKGHVVGVVIRSFITFYFQITLTDNPYPLLSSTPYAYYHYRPPADAGFFSLIAGSLKRLLTPFFRAFQYP